MDKIGIKAPAKINLFLDIVGKLQNGYHEIKSVMQTVDLFDYVKVEKSDEITVDCNNNAPEGENNIAFKAAKLFLEESGISAKINIFIEKNIPIAAGLAGGSTDAAGVLKLMNRLFNVNADDEELRTLGLKLGADVPYCINGGTALCEGIGEKITQLKPFKDKIVVIVKPPFGVSTKDVFISRTI